MFVDIPYKFEQDPISSACAVYRNCRQRGVIEYPELTTAIPTDEDHCMANSIRNYYSAKFVEHALRGGSISEFRAKMMQLLQGTRPPDTSDIGILYRMPYFYQEDIDTDRYIESASTTDRTEFESIYGKFGPIEVTETLRLKQKILRNARGGVTIRYGFLNQRQYPVVVSIDTKNPFFTLVDQLFQQPSVQLHGWLVYQPMRGLNAKHTVLSMIKPTLVQ